MGQYYSNLGDGSSGFVADGDGTGDVTMTYRDGWSIVTSAVVKINGERVDMTDAEVGEEREVGGFLLVRTERGVKARSIGRRRRYR
jgi:hypothetical protein